MTTSRHIPPRNPHPKRRTRHKQASRVLSDTKRTFSRWNDEHDLCTTLALMRAGDERAIIRIKPVSAPPPNPYIAYLDEDKG